TNVVPFAKRGVGDNERAHDSDRYLEGRTETVEQSTFLWYPWTIAMATTLQQDRVIDDYQRDRLRNLTSMLLMRADDAGKFARNDAVIYPTAEIALTSGYYLLHK